jgi:hypothetical protein
MAHRHASAYVFTKEITLYKAFKITLVIASALALVFVVTIPIITDVVEWAARPTTHTVTLNSQTQAPAVPQWSEALGAIGVPNAGLTYLKHAGRFYRADYCNVEGYGVPAGEIDYEDGRNWLNDPDCMK